jgi:hypothetical protein
MTDTSGWRKRQIALNQKAENARELGLDYEHEPIAVKRMMEWVYVLKRRSDNGQHMNIQSGLTAGTCWEFAIELENFIKHTNSPQIAINPETVGYVAPQRTWVGLTDEEIKAFDTWHDNREEEVGWCNPSEIVAYIEAKLRSKNNV